MQTEKLTLTTLEVVPLVEAVVIPMVAQFLDAGVFRGDEIHTQAAAVLLSELDRWADALKGCAPDREGSLHRSLHSAGSRETSAR